MKVERKPRSGVVAITEVINRFIWAGISAITIREKNYRYAYGIKLNGLVQIEFRKKKQANGNQ